MRKVMRVQTFLVNQRREIADLLRNSDRELVSQEVRKNRIILAYVEPVHWTELLRFNLWRVKHIAGLLRKKIKKVE